MLSWRLRRIAMAGLLLAIPATTLADDKKEDKRKKAQWTQALLQGIDSQDSDVRRDAVAGVDPDDKDGVKAILNILKLKELRQIDWYIRTAAIEVLCRANDEKAVAELGKGLEAKDPAQREGAALACGKVGDPAHLPGLLKLLEDKEASVRRAAARGLAGYSELEVVDALLARWAKDKAPAQYRDQLAYHGTLVHFTEEKGLGRDVAAWQAFWDKAKAEGWKFPAKMSPDEKAALAEAKKKKAEEAEAAEKKEITTEVRGVEYKFTEVGYGSIPLIVIPDDSWKPDYFEPYLSILGDACKIYYVELPSINKFDRTKLKKNIEMVYYPVDELCDAFEELRKKAKHEKFAVLAHGFSTLIAQRYLSKYAENVSHVILIGAMPGDDAYGNMLDKLRSKATSQKDKELERLVDSLFITDTKTRKTLYTPKTDKEYEALARKYFSIMFANPQDPEIAEIWARSAKAASLTLKAKKDEECLMPPFDTARERKPNVPMLVIMGERSIWTSVTDGERVQKNYPVSQLVVLKESAMMPWFEEPGRFSDEVKKFLKAHTPKGSGDGKKTSR